MKVIERRSGYVRGDLLHADPLKIQYSIIGNFKFALLRANPLLFLVSKSLSE